MRLTAGLIGLLAVLAVVGWLVKTQLKALPPPPATATAGAVSSPADRAPATVSRRTQQQVTDDVGRALDQGMRRNDDAEARP